MKSHAKVWEKRATGFQKRDLGSSLKPLQPFNGGSLRKSGGASDWFFLGDNAVDIAGYNQKARIIPMNPYYLSSGYIKI
jgi:hypothetical protein